MADRLKFGYFTLTDNSVGYGARRRDPGDLIKDVVTQAVAAEGLGYNSAWLPEHHFGFFGVLPTPAQALTFIAARTSRLRLAPATVLLPCTQPLRTAEEYAVLDVLSDGRAIFSAGRGYDEREYVGFEIPFAESRTRFDEELLIVRKAWTEENWTFHGQHHTIAEPINVVPKPIQKPHPPVYVACFSEPTMRMAAEQGLHIIFAPFAASMVFGSLANAVAKFKELSRAAGFPDSRAMCSYFTCIADTPAQKLAAQERLLYYLTNFIPAVPQDPEKTPPHIRYFVDIAERVKRMQAQDLGERSIVTGTADEVIRQFEQVEAAGIEEVICYFNFGLLPHAETMHQMERVSREVMPHFAPGGVPERVHPALVV
jgi:alkanesulfonate monooxygenase SsuD/methylene tetrahydromethanopterin reductase-like flavin-dependent oxidoreductase (luciferase family)